MAKLWQKSYTLDSLMESFTVGNDPVLDLSLVNADCVASMAHAEMLASIGILSRGEAKSLHAALQAILAHHAAGDFRITRADEDCHTAIENALVKAVGEAGKKIHTGRSRNDQVLTALRLWMRGYLKELITAQIDCATRLLDLAARHEQTPMPGRTHMQTAMPSSVGLWAAAFAEELLDDIRLARGAFEIVDCCPLGSAASYGVPLPLDREMTARLLGFARVQNNVLYANNSRGKFESIILGAVEQSTLTLSKLAQDLILFSLPEFGYFHLPAELCTGSSIMPQKKNPDGLELVRARSASVSADAMALASIIRALPTGYNRDFQETKGPFFHGCETGLACLRIMALTVEKLEVDEAKLRKSLNPDIYAADKALELVSKGIPFRDAYKQVGASLDALSTQDPVQAIKSKTSTGAPGNLRLDVGRAAIAELSAWMASAASVMTSAIRALAGAEVALFSDPASPT
jgi:argininosuccinate lyase